MAKLPTSVQPQHWSVDNLITFGDHVIHELAVKSTGTTTSYRLVLGRCLMAVDETKLYQQFGCSGAIHYARNILGLGKKEAQTLRRVARELERLPRLRQAAEHGTTSWSKLREIVGKATPETEEAWLALAGRMSPNDLARVAARTEFGGMPAEMPEDENARKLVHFRLQLGEETHELFQRAAQVVSKSLEKAVSVTEALEYLVVEHLEKKPATEDRVDKAREEAAHSRARRQAQRERLLDQARTIVAQEKEREDPLVALQQALGSEPLFLEDETLVQGEDVRVEGNRVQVEWDDDAVDLDLISAERDLRPARDVSEEDVPNEAMWQRQVGGPARDFSGSASPIKAAQRNGADGPAWDHSESESTPERTEPGLTNAERLAQWRAMFEATDEKCPGNPDLFLVDPDHWKARRLRFNPKARKLTTAQRREILRRDGHRCRVPGCTHHVWLDVHHYIPLSQDGPTLPWNLLTLCTRCHANVHAGFLIIEFDPESGFRFLNRGLTPVDQPSLLEVAHWIDFWLGWSGGPYDCHKGRDWAFEEAS